MGIFIKSKYFHIIYSLIIYTILFVITTPIFSTNHKNYEYSFIDVEDGLSQNSVGSIYQDISGFIWIATADGLNRYDGYNFKIFRNIPNDSNSINNNFINMIFHSYQNGFWVCTDNGISFYDNMTGHFKNYNLNHVVNNGIVIDNENLCLQILSNGHIELYKFNHKKNTINQIYKFDKYVSRNPFKIKKDNKGRIWLINLDKVMRLSEDGSVVFETDIVSPDGKSIVDLVFSRNNLKILATNKNIYILNDNNSIKERLILHPDYENIRFCDMDNKDNLWICASDTNGFAKYNFRNKKFTKLIVSNPKQPFSITNLHCKLIDRSGVVWLGSDGGGVTRYNPYQRKFKLLSHEDNNPNSLSANFPKGMVVDSKNNLWVGTVKSGLSKYDINSNKWEHYNNKQIGNYYIQQNIVISVFEDSKNTLWKSGYNSFDTDFNNATIDTFDTKYKKFNHFLKGRFTQKFFEDSDGNIWFFGKTLISKYDRKQNKIINLSKVVYDKIANKFLYLYTISQTNDRNIWVGTGNGIYRFDINMNFIKSYIHNSSDNFSLSHNHVLTLLKDSKGRLWAGTRDGLNLYLPDSDNFFEINVSNGLPNSFIYGILEDKNSDYWISTNKGLSRLRFIDTNNFTFRNYKFSDGLQSNEFNTDAYTQSSSGYLFFGGIGGINYFHPDSILDNVNIPNVVITSINLFDLPYKTSTNTHCLKELVLEYYENTLSFEFAALEFSNPIHNQYAYYMVGVDTGWVYSGEKRFARYANLKPGKYEFKVKASNNDEIWNEVGTTLRIIIKPPFWATLEFRIFLVIFSIILIIIIYYYIVYKTRQRNNYLESVVKERTEELRQNNEQLAEQAIQIKGINEILEKKVEERTIQLKEINEQQKIYLKEVTESKAESLKAIIKNQEDERSRFAKDLHDGASQYLTFLKFNINNVILKIDDSNLDIKNNLKEQVKLIDNVVQELRQFAYSLMPPVLERIGLNAAIEELLDTFKASTNIRVDYYIQNKIKPLPKHSKIQVYRIIQEVLNNSVKHSQCTNINFQLLTYPSNILIIIEDNGKGFDTSTTKTGMGLKNIYSRLALLNGKIDIDSQINHGTTITIEVPN